MSQSSLDPPVRVNPAERLAEYFAPDDGRDALRVLGGLLVGLGFAMVFLRKSTPGLGSGWGDFGLFAVLLVATVFLYGIALAGRAATGTSRPWEAVYAVFGVVLAPFTLAQFVQLVNGTPGAPLNIAWIFLVTAALAAFAGMNGFRYGWLLACIALIVSWSALWSKILSNGLAAHFGVYRALLLVLAAALLVAGWVARGAGRSRAATSEARPGDPGLFAEFVTGASIAAVIAGGLSIGRLAALANPFATVPGPSSALGWEIVLLIVSLAALAWGSRAAVRGPVYVGGFGLLLFLFIAGADLNDSSPSSSLMGWPVVLVIVGIVAFVLSVFPGLKVQSPIRSASGQGSPPPGPST